MAKKENNQATVALTPAVARTLIQHDQGSGLTEDVARAALKVAETERIPITGLTILGGKFYVNTTGLDTKLDNICRERGWVKKRVEAELLKEYEDEDSGGYRCGFRGTIELFDKASFMEALDTLVKKLPKDQVTMAFVNELAEKFTYVYIDEGWAGMQSVKMGTMKNKDFLRMMANRRATNRAKRAATGTGLTSVEELDIEVDFAKRPQGQVERGSPVEGHAPSRPASKKIIATILGDRVQLSGYTHAIVGSIKEEFSGIFLKDLKVWQIPQVYLHEIQELCERTGLEYEEYEAAEAVIEGEVVGQSKPEVKERPDAETRMVHEVTGPHSSAKDSQYLKLKWGKDWIYCWKGNYFSYLQEATGQECSFVVSGGRYPNLERVVHIGGREFTEDGVPVLDVNDNPGDLRLKF